jgi:hypothetical protein
MARDTSQLVVDYTTLSLADVRIGLDEMARDTQATFGQLDTRQLNWRPDARRWSVAQCLDHLLAANRLMFQAAAAALDHTQPRTVWQRLPILPGVFGPMLIRSQAPNGARKFTASPKAQPSASDIAAGIVHRIVEQHRDAVGRLDRLDEREATRTIMTSPFISVIVYSVLDGWRLVVAHDRRHFEQARFVTLSPGFPKERTVS